MISAKRSLSPSPYRYFYRDDLAFGPAEFAEPLNKSGDPKTIGRFGLGWRMTCHRTDTGSLTRSRAT